MKEMRYLRSVPIPDPPPFPDPHLSWVCQIVRQWDRKTSADIGIVGIPFDKGTVSHRRGSRFAPERVREIFYANTTFCFEHGLDLSKLKIVDCGDIEVDVMSYEKTHRRVEETLTPLFSSGMTYVLIGGDHSVTSPSIKALCNSLENKERVGVVQFDAHHDCRADWKENSGLWVHEILEIEGSPIRGENIVQIGIHGFLYSKFYSDYIKKNKIKVFTASEVRKRGIESVMEEGMERAGDGTDLIYVSIDIDAVDEAFAPGTDHPRPGGITNWDLLTAAVLIGENPLTKVMDLMEISPPLDINDMTSKLGAEAIMNFLCGLCLQKKL